jgi:hypothetical protein
VISDTGGEVEYWVEYGPTSAYGSESAHGTISVPKNTVHSVSRQIEGLERSTTYHYRLCARDSTQQGGPGCGEDKQFTTVNLDCGDQITTDVRLSGDLICDPVGLIVAADGVDIDLGGFAILSTPAIDNSGGYDDVTVRDGNLEGFTEAVRLENASRNRLVRLRIGTGFPLVPPSTGLGVRMSGGEDNVLRDTRVFGESGGLAVTGSDRLVVQGSRLSGRFGTGASVSADFARILNSRLFGDHEEGLVIQGSGNRVRNSDLGGTTGVLVASGESNVIIESRAAGGARFPIEPTDNSPFGDGIHVAAAAAGTLLRANVANGSQGDGIEVLSPSTRLLGNTANDNDLWGIDGVLGVIDLGGNTASGNGLGQCRFVAC